jgi:hypothetical protein
VSVDLDWRSPYRSDMGRSKREAFVYGVVGGGLVVVAGSLLSWSGRLSLVIDLVWFGLSVLVAPAAAASSARASGAAAPRVLAVAGLAFLLAFCVVNVVDYGLTVLLLMPDAPGPFQGKTELSADDVTTIADAWLLRRHVGLCALGVVGGSALDVFWTRR